ncbi:MAG: DUF996 domain-containing protein [Nitrososphaerota archaeon]|jgi:uncharacterized membrane protein|nr:DUF996 domain-containing protein [Nitrososphaerota archaeon]MDG6978227.1 DUF996 domain-containing protein [Nitrososphaerota archaeon]MDG7021186.1 DUF996 domain-containing protein [Nitrososphaerota archaeon]MDG7021867.1 DUF996 domain-containing protein [Nitrososphaerota archaeon]
MATLSQAKTIGGVGSILIFIPFVSLVGYILLVVAVKEISDDLQDRSIFNNIVVAAVTGIVAALSLAGGVLLGLLSPHFTVGAAGLAGIGIGLFLAWIFFIVSAVFLRRAYDSMGTRLGVGTFKTAATLYLVGAVLTIVLVGTLVLFVAEIVQAVAYFSIPGQTPASGASAPASAPTVATPARPAEGESSKFCTSCGTRISPTATFCYKCGAKQP